ncbi:hypothetical protein [Humisphaera borealis]|uniref:Tetratricopeptide repeat protein n=1 Tax=Humisphaera borealis TaxID=2807512 RepID=A0A7M2X094_9BACT|nr:hypothetical protein [Humisphaera borealis]QOV90160.1 hypothetical protein IPV69_01940 [Humisphaera borealis]
MPRDDQHFQKALYLLDRGEVERGEALLRQVLDAAERAEDLALQSTAQLCLGKLLVELDRVPEAVAHLKRVAALDEYDDLVAHERRKAIELLRKTGVA